MKILGCGGGLASRLLVQILCFVTGLDHPIVAFTRVILRSLDLHKSLLETEVMANAVLPASISRAIKGVVVADPLVNLSKCQASVGGSEDGHCNQVGVAEGRFVAIIDNWRKTVVGRNNGCRLYLCLRLCRCRCRCRWHWLSLCLLDRPEFLDGSSLHESALAVWLLIVVADRRIYRMRCGEELRVDVLLSVIPGHVKTLLWRHGFEVR
jgi:hypothetical protein